MATTLKKRIICKNVTNRKPFKGTRVCRNKYKYMNTVKHRLYWRDDEKACFENMHGTDVNTSSKGQCGWSLNDKKKVSDNFRDLKYPLEFVWRQH